MTDKKPCINQVDIRECHGVNVLVHDTVTIAIHAKHLGPESLALARREAGNVRTASSKRAGGNHSIRY